MSTEDEIIARLKRISISELEDRCWWLTTEIKRNEWQKTLDTIQKEIADRNMAITFGLLTRKVQDLSIGDHIFIDVSNESFKGTGWTYESYKATACNFYHKLRAARKVHTRKQILCWTVIPLIASISCCAVSLIPVVIWIRVAIYLLIGGICGWLIADQAEKLELQRYKNEICPFRR